MLKEIRGVTNFLISYFKVFYLQIILKFLPRIQYKLFFHLPPFLTLKFWFQRKSTSFPEKIAKHIQGFKTKFFFNFEEKHFISSNSSNLIAIEKPGELSMQIICSIV